MAEKPKVVKVLINTFCGQVGGSRFLKEVGLLKREPNPCDWDILLPEKFLKLAGLFLISNDWKQKSLNRGPAKYGGEVIDFFDTFEKEGVTIDLFRFEGIINPATAMLHKSSIAGDHKKHLADLAECFSSLMKD